MQDVKAFAVSMRNRELIDLAHLLRYLLERFPELGHVGCEALSHKDAGKLWSRRPLKIADRSEMH